MSRESDTVKGRIMGLPSGRTWLHRATGWVPLLVVAGIIIGGAAVGGAMLRARSASQAPFASSSIARAPDFQISVYQGEDLLGGEEVKFSELLAQGQPVVLNMWAGLCPPCRVEMPDLQEVSEEYQGRVLLFGLDVGPFVGLGSREDGRALLEELKVTYPNGTTFDGEVVAEYRVIGMPTTYFIKPNGEVVRQATGLMNKEKMTELVEELLAKSGGS